MSQKETSDRPSCGRLSHRQWSGQRHVMISSWDVPVTRVGSEIATTSAVGQSSTANRPGKCPLRRLPPTLGGDSLHFLTTEVMSGQELRALLSAPSFSCYPAVFYPLPPCELSLCSELACRTSASGPSVGGGQPAAVCAARLAGGGDGSRAGHLFSGSSNGACKRARCRRLCRALTFHARLWLPTRCGFVALGAVLFGQQRVVDERRPEASSCARAGRAHNASWGKEGKRCAAMNEGGVTTRSPYRTALLSAIRWKAKIGAHHKGRPCGVRIGSAQRQGHEH